MERVPRPEHEETGVDWVELQRVASFTDLHAAHAAQSLLRSEGIESFVENAHLTGVAWPHGSVAGGPRLSVRASDVERAHELLRPFGGLAAERAAARSAPLASACPNCASRSVEPVRRRGWLASLLGALMGTAARARRSHLRCRSCGCEYQD